MTQEEQVRKELIHRFGDAYRAFGLSKLMGHVVALLLYSPGPVSLDEISKSLKRSKGPVSQIVRRLRDHNLIRKAWITENNRKDYYEIEPAIFENAFRNNLELIKSNTRIASEVKAKFKSNRNKDLETTALRVLEMERFYSLMEKHYEKFLNEWTKERKKIYK
ncbi:MAG: MarR family transcriptional regulator [Ignavibacteriaceae bacterium]|nr:MarR family transcriptional regulator [Ignavibacteriaceae bacterium]